MPLSVLTVHYIHPGAYAPRRTAHAVLTEPVDGLELGSLASEMVMETEGQCPFSFTPGGWTIRWELARVGPPVVTGSVKE